MYSIFLEKNVIKYLSKLDKESYTRIILKIEKLSQNPFPSNSKRIVNVKDKVYRIRIGFYRVLYRIQDSKIIVIFLIDKRSKVYDTV